MIRNYNEFVEKLLDYGFCLGGGNDEGIFSIISWNWTEPPPDESPICWHTGDIETDPWEWRTRVLNERKDIAYSKVFFKKTGFITKKWYPYFLAARRGGISFEEAYEDGTISHFAKRIYEIVTDNERLPVDVIKKLAGFTREDKSGFDRALVELQMKMFLTMCGAQQKLSKTGEEYGWSSTVFCSVEKFFGEAVMEETENLNREEAVDAIRAQILKINPSAQEKKIAKFIKG